MHHPAGPNQYFDLAKALSESSEFKGSNYSVADKIIEKKGKFIGGPGHPQKWVEVGINHHITFVIDQLSKLVA